MDDKGHIYLDPTEDEIKKKKLIEIPKGDVEPLINGNRAERRKWYREQCQKAKQLAKTMARLKGIESDVKDIEAAVASHRESEE